MINVVRRLRAFFVPLLLSLATGVAHSAWIPSLIIEDGQLVGADAVNVDGTIYNVRFVDGTCAIVFGDCQTDRFIFNNSESAINASVALFNQVLFDEYDTSPEITSGCENEYVCWILTPYDTLTSLNVRTASAGNHAEFNKPGTIDGEVSFDTSLDDRFVWAVWTPTEHPYNDDNPIWMEATTVPEPSSLALVTAASLGLAGLRRRARRTRTSDWHRS